MFTAKSIFLLVIIILLFAIAWNTDITMVYILFVVAFVLFVLCFIHLQFNIPSISIVREVHDTASEDDIVNVNFVIRNKRPLNIRFFEIIDSFTGAAPDKHNTSLFLLELRPRENKKISYVMDCYKRGLHKFGPITVVSQDAIGFFKMKTRIKEISEILVYPKLFRVFSFPPLASGSVSWMGVETAKISGDNHEFFGIREYQRGDMISRIHWPSTARHNRLIVKQFERNAIQEATIIFDLKKGHDIGVGRETTVEYAVKIAGSIASFILNEGVFVQMAGYADETVIVPFGKGEGHMYRILEYLAKAQATGESSLSHALEETTFVTPHRSTLIVIMLDNDIDSLSSLVHFKVKGIKLILIILSTSTFGHMEEIGYLDKDAAKRFEEALASLECYVYRVSKGDDLEKKFEVI